MSDLEEAIELLIQSDLKATKSRLNPANILGGLARVETDIGAAYEDAFWIKPEGEVYIVSLTGPGNLSTDFEATTRLKAAQKIVEHFREQGLVARQLADTKVSDPAKALNSKPLEYWVGFLTKSMLIIPERSVTGRCWNRGYLTAARELGIALGDPELFEAASKIARELNSTDVKE